MKTIRELRQKIAAEAAQQQGGRFSNFSASAAPKGFGRISGTDDSRINISHHDEGGELDPNAINEVGESGPEYIVGGQVIPEDDSKGLGKIPTSDDVAELRPFGPPQPKDKPVAAPVKAQTVQDAPDADTLPIRSIDRGLGTIGAAPSPEVIRANSESSEKLANPDQLAFQKQLINEDKMRAASKGDLVGLGTANIHEQELAKQNPWGSAANHPGTWGKILHGIAEAGQITGDVLAPAATSLIPGTDLNRERNEQEGFGQIREGEENNLQNAQAKNTLSEAANRSQQTADLKSNQSLTNSLLEKGYQLQTDPTTGKQSLVEIPGYRDVAKPIQDLLGSQVAAAQAAERDPFTDPTVQSTLKVLQASQKPEKADDFETFYAQYLKDHGAKDSTANRLAARKQYTAAGEQPQRVLMMVPGPNGTQQAVEVVPGTTITSSASKPGESSKDAHATYTYTDDDGVTRMVSGDQVPQGAEALKIKDPASLIGEAHSANVVQEALNNLHEDVADHPEIFDDPKSRAILATALDDERAKSLGLLVAGTGGSLTMPAGVNKIIDTFLENNGANGAERTALKQYIVDYWSMKDKAMVIQMAMQNGKMGRGSAAAFDSIVAQIPGGATPDSVAARRQLSNLQATQSELMNKYPDVYGSYTKVKPYKASQTTPTSRSTGARPSFTEWKKLQVQ